MYKGLFIWLFSLSTVYASQQSLETQATIKPEREVTLSSQIKGKINVINVDEGDSFHSGDILLKFDCTVYESELTKAQAAFEKAKSVYIADQKLKRMRAISDVDYQAALSDYKEKKAELAIKKHLVSWCQIKAPYSGTITKSHIQLHQTIAEGDELLDIIDSKNIIVELIVPSRWLSWLKVGSPFKIMIDETQQTYSANVEKIVSKIDAVSQTVKVIAKISGETDNLLPGMSGKAIFEREE